MSRWYVSIIGALLAGSIAFAGEPLTQQLLKEKAEVLAKAAHPRGTPAAARSSSIGPT